MTASTAGPFRSWCGIIQCECNTTASICSKIDYKVCQPPLNANLEKGVFETNENNIKTMKCKSLYKYPCSLGKFRWVKLLTLSCLYYSPNGKYFMNPMKKRTRHRLIWWLVLQPYVELARAMPGRFRGDTYKRTKLWVYFRPNHWTCRSSFRALGRDEWHTALELSSRMPPFGNHIVDSLWPMWSRAWALSEMNQMVFLVKLAAVLADRIN